MRLPDVLRPFYCVSMLNVTPVFAVYSLMVILIEK